LFSNRLCFGVSGFGGNWYRFRRSFCDSFGKGLWLGFAGNDQFGSRRLDDRFYGRGRFVNCWRLRFEQGIVVCSSAFQSYFSFPTSFEVIRGFPKFGEALAHRLGQLWQLARAEENERDYEDEEQLSAAEAIENECEEHGSLPSCKNANAVNLAGVGMPEESGSLGDSEL